MVKTAIIILKPHNKISIPEIFCQHIESYIANYNHIKIITHEFLPFIQQVSNYFLLYKDYKLYADESYMAIIYQNNGLIITSVEAYSTKPIELIIFDNVLPSEYPYDKNDIQILSIIQCYNKRDYDFYYNIINSKAKFEILDNPTDTIFTNTDNIYFMNGVVDLSMLGNIDITPVISNINNKSISLPYKIYLNFDNEKETIT